MAWQEFPLHVLAVVVSLVAFFGVWVIGWRLLNKSGPIAESGLWRRTDTAVREFCSSPGLLGMVACWAILEATVWFIIPEFPLLLVLFLRTRGSRLALLGADVVGSILGAVFAYSLGVYAGSSWVDAVPYVTTPMVEQARIWQTCLGTTGLFYQPYSGVPFKVFGATAHESGLSAFGFVTVGLGVRIQRYAVVYALLAAVAYWKVEWFTRNFWRWVPVAILLYTAALMASAGTYDADYERYYAYQTQIDKLENALGRTIDRC